VDFNLSHSAGVALLAMSSGVAVGVDVEEVEPGIADSGVAEHFFAPAEVQHLLSLPDQARDRAFVECWTRKEAFIKGKGGGLSLPLDGFEVLFGPRRPARLVRSDTDPSDCTNWTLVDLTEHVPRRFVAAVAVHAVSDGFTIELDDGGRKGRT
jgi:4'-phosphopantetheinyl transferase